MPAVAKDPFRAGGTLMVRVLDNNLSVQILDRFATDVNTRLCYPAIKHATT